MCVVIILSSHTHTHTHSYIWKPKALEKTKINLIQNFACGEQQRCCVISHAEEFERTKTTTPPAHQQLIASSIDDAEGSENRSGVCCFFTFFCGCGCGKRQKYTAANLISSHSNVHLLLLLLPGSGEQSTRACISNDGYTQRSDEKSNFYGIC